ncbi:Epimerase domain-containing protein [Citrus sinensis]|uniref:Epimerase domain-containing protein n=1 Tax=Citrus sinensis TaxID=2711 RepID=A0ACB8MVY3_CITSI|nr:Epimerase domain-containing protein [Citrus sinensis]
MSSVAAAAGKVVCVTGASGYIASWLVKLLLSRGYTVKASVRDPNDPKKTRHLLALDGASERLQLFKANLLEEGSFDSIVDGCDGVCHTASPFYHDAKDPQVELLDPAVKGTLNVLNSCAKFPSIKRVVLTSSMAAVLNTGKPRTPDVVVDETWFSDPELWYPLSKTLAEDAAWKFAKEKSIDLVTINPAMVIGPLLQPTLNTSAAAVLSLIKGAQTYPNVTFGWVNVKDVANAHIQAFEVPSANGRYCLVERVSHYSEIVNIIRELYPAFQLPEKCADDKPHVPTYQVLKEKVKNLGIEFIPVEFPLAEDFVTKKGSLRNLENAQKAEQDKLNEFCQLQMHAGLIMFFLFPFGLKFIYDLGLHVGRCDGASANASTRACRSGIRMNFVNHPLANRGGKNIHSAQTRTVPGHCGPGNTRLRV